MYIEPLQLSEQIISYLNLIAYLKNDLDKWVNENIGIPAEKLGKPKR